MKILLDNVFVGKAIMRIIKILFVNNALRFGFIIIHLIEFF